MIILRGRGIRKTFGGLAALDDVDFELHEGECLGLIGPNGSGKTTLLNVISGFYAPDRGAIIYRGKDITRWRPDKVCRLGIGRTFQLIHPFKSLNVFDNVKVGAIFGRAQVHKTSQHERDIAEILETVDLFQKRHMPVDSLTIGDLRRLELARALATNPDVLLIDEVLAGLTPVETLALIEKIRSIRERGVTILIIAHDMKVIMGLSDRIMVLDFGRKIAEGEPHSVARNEEVIKAYLGDTNVA